MVLKVIYVKKELIEAEAFNLVQLEEHKGEESDQCPSDDDQDDDSDEHSGNEQLFEQKQIKVENESN